MLDKRKKNIQFEKVNFKNITVAQTIQVVVSLLVGILVWTIWYMKKKKNFMKKWRENLLQLYQRRQLYYES